MTLSGTYPRPGARPGVRPSVQPGPGSLRAAAPRPAAILPLFALLFISRSLLVSRNLAAEELLLDRFPITVPCGLAAPAASAAGEAILPDLPFDPARGYGYVGGEAESRPAAAILGGQPGWEAAWRERPLKYSFHVPNDEYLLQLSFVETVVRLGGRRVFDVIAEEEALISRLDIAREAGDFRWLTVEGLVTVRDGWLDLRFVSSGSPLPPRVSRIRILPAAGAPFAPPAPAPRGRGSFHAVRLRWEAPPVQGLAGYGVFRAESDEGPWESLTAAPVLVPEYADRSAIPGAPYRYRVRAYGVRGGQSPLSPPATLSAADQLPGKLQSFGIEVSAADLPRLWTRAEPAPTIPGELLFYGGRYPIEITPETAAAAWQFRKSYKVEVGGSRRFFGRKTLLFLGEAGDATLLRENLYFEIERLLGLAAPRVQPIHLQINGEYVGLHLDREALDSRFRLRSQLDAVGDFGILESSGSLPLDWSPPGVSVEGEGSLWNLILLLHELYRVNETELEDYFAERFYLDRLIDRLAAAAVCGRDSRMPPPRFFLGDSRNGRWEFITTSAPDGAFGISSFQEPRGGPADAEAARRALLGPALRGAELPDRWEVLEARLFSQPALWKRYLDRIEELARGPLAPEVFERLARAAHAVIAPAMEEQPRWWPEDGGRTFAAAPEQLAAGYRAHLAALLEVIASERRREPEPLVVSEFLLRPHAAAAISSIGASLDGAWIEIHNRSSAPVDLGRYRLAADPDRPGEWSFPAARLAPGERKLVTLGSGGGPFHSLIRPAPGGGLILLTRIGERGRHEVADAVFYGWQTAGISCGRTEDGGWASFPEPTPGAPNRGAAAGKPPPWGYRQGMVVGKDDEITIWARADAPSAGGAPAGGGLASMTLYRRPPGSPDFEALPMKWTGDGFRYEAVLPAPAAGERVPYFFLARSESGVERPYPLTGPDLPIYLPSRPQLFINEVLPRPSPEGPQREFVELYNAGDFPVSIEGMFLTDTQKNPVKWRIPHRPPIPPKAFAVLYADGTGKEGHAPFKLSNSGEYLGLHHRMEEGNVLIDQMTFPAVPADHSFGRGRDGEKGFRVWRDPTPGDKNLPKIPEEFLHGKEGVKDGAKDDGKEGAEEGAENDRAPGKPGPGGTEGRAEGAGRDD